MNFYKHHIGDYAQATAHLSFVEDAAYSRCLRKYYAEEAPLPVDLKAVQRLVGARTREEKEAVQTVLEEFFTLHDDGWRNKRADAELSRANAQAETNRQIAEEREARKRARKEHESFNESFNDKSTIRSPAPMVEREPSQTPDTRHQTPDATTSGKEESGGQRPPPDLTAKDLMAEGVDPTHARDWLKARKAKKAPLTQTAWDGVKAEAAKAGMNPAQAVKLAAESSWQGFKAEWVHQRPASGARPTGAPIDTQTRNAEARRLLGFETPLEIPNA